MSKRDDLMKLGGGNILSSMGANQTQGLPAGLDPASAMRKPAHLEGVSKEKQAARIALDRIEPDPDQPREDFETEPLERLAESLRTRGQLQPVRVRWDEGRGVYVILVGERRWRAARMAGLADLSCIVVEGPIADDERLMIQLVENALREDLRPVEQAKAYRALMTLKGWSGNQLSKELQIAQSSVVRALALLDLPAPVQAQVEQGTLAATVAAELTRIPDAEAQVKIANAVVHEGLTRSEVTQLVQAVRSRRPTTASRPDPMTIDLGDGSTVTVRWKKANGLSATQLLRKALKILQDRDRDEQAA